MKKISLWLAFVVLALISCKKETADVNLPAREDYAGQYSVTGNIRVLSGDSTLVKPFLWANTISDTTAVAGAKFQVFASAFQQTYPSTGLLGYRIGLNGSASQIGEFWLEIIGKSGSNTLAEKMADLLQPGAQLPIGQGAGQINIHIVNPIFIRWYNTDVSNSNSANFVTVEKVEDLNASADEFQSPPKWAKKITLSFSCHMKEDYDFTEPDIMLENCKVVLPFIFY